MERRISLFVPSLTYGGAEQVAVRLANGFISQGCSVTLVTATPGDDLSHLLDDRVEYISLGAPRVLRSVPSLARHIYSARPDALIAFMTHTNIAAILANTLAGGATRIIATEHNSLQHRSGGRKEQIVLAGAARLYSQTKKVVAVSSGLATEISTRLDLPDELVTTIHNPVPIPECSGSPPHPWFNQAPPIVVAAGRHVPQKDYSTLLRAIAHLRGNRDSDIRLVLLGEGTETTSLKRLAASLSIDSSVSFPGFVESPYPYMAAADVFALSSQWEGFGNVLVEAMGLGTPVVSTDCPVGPSEILRDGQYGPLVPVGDPEALATAIETTVQTPPDSTELRERAAEFAPDRITSQYLALVPK